ncbi:MAG: histone deacetylase [Planctomycetes bacterium]|nr:histone deacetylase [Planctomycetota bacterium]
MPRKLALITHPVFSKHDTGSHPEVAARLVAMEAALKEDAELSRHISALEPQPASDEAILRCHSKAYLETLESARGGRGRLDPDTVFSPHSIEAARHAAGAAAAAVDFVLAGQDRAAFAMVRPPGHHACPERGMGFCFINNAAVAARHAQSRGPEKILIIDFDVHHGNGSQDIFYEDPSVFYYSLHLHPHYPGTGMEDERGWGRGAGTTLNRPLPHGFPAERYRSLYQRDLDGIIGSFKPDLAIISAGFDSHRRDPLGGLALESDDFWEITRAVCERMPPGRVAGTLEGGYNLEVIGAALCKHLRALAGLPRE